jgi:hypothetical protein
MSTIRQSDSPKSGDINALSPDSKAVQEKPYERAKRLIPRRTDASSSITVILNTRPSSFTSLVGDIVLNDGSNKAIGNVNCTFLYPWTVVLGSLPLFFLL